MFKKAKGGKKLNEKSGAKIVYVIGEAELALCFSLQFTHSYLDFGFSKVRIFEATKGSIILDTLVLCDTFGKGYHSGFGYGAR
jgi:hypothetical protein